MPCPGLPTELLVGQPAKANQNQRLSQVSFAQIYGRAQGEGKWTCLHNGHWGQWIQLSAWPAYWTKKIVNTKQKTENESCSQVMNCANELLNTSWHVRRVAGPESEDRLEQARKESIYNRGSCDLKQKLTHFMVINAVKCKNRQANIAIQWEF